MNNSRLFPVRFIGKCIAPFTLFSVVVFQSVAVADTQYGPIRAGETLSSIVNENYLVSPFPDQVIMREIFRKNPKAFIYNKIGLLKQGVILTLPSDESIASAQPAASLRVAPVRTQTASTVVPTQQNNEAIRALESKLTSVRAERDRAKDRLRKLEAETVDLTARVAELELANAQLNDEIKTADSAIKAARLELAEVKSNAEKDLALAKSQENTSNASGQTDQSASISERDQRIKSLEASIAKLHDTQESELLELKAALEAKGEEQQVLEGRVKALTDDATKFTAQINGLKKKNETLVVELAESKEAYDDLLANKALDKVAESSEVSKSNDSIKADDGSFDISAVNTQNIPSQLEKTVTFPLWGLLLGALALALTTLLMFLARGRAKKAVGASVVPLEESLVSTTDDVVFKVADPERVEPDVEALRVPPRRDPSRVAILDPTMEEVTNTINDSPAFDDESKLTEHQLRESDLKLAMAEAYGDLGDVQAANELLLEVQQEGSQKQSASAQILLNRLVG